MSDTFVQVPTGEKIDGTGLTVGGNNVQRQRTNIADPAAPAAIAGVQSQQPLPSDYGLTVRPIRMGQTSTVARVPDTATSTILQAANGGRVSVAVTNDSSAVLFVLKNAGTASPTNYTYRLNQYDTVVIDDYAGQVNGVWATSPGDGGAQVTEVTT